LLTEGAFDKAAEWTQLTATQRATVKSQYAAAGIKIIVSLFGSTDVPTTSGADPIATANTMAAWVKQFDLDGVDVDYEVNSLSLTDYPIDLTLEIRTSTLSTRVMERQKLG
jgi:chitinase